MRSSLSTRPHCCTLWHFLIQCSLSNPGSRHYYHSCSTDQETPKTREILGPFTLQSLRISAGQKAGCCPLGHMPRCWHFMAEISTCFLADRDLQSPGDLIQRGIFPSQSVMCSLSSKCRPATPALPQLVAQVFTLHPPGASQWHLPCPLSGVPENRSFMRSSSDSNYVIRETQVPRAARGWEEA